MGYIFKNRHKFYLKCHLIFVCKYRKRLLVSDIRECVLSSFKEIESKCDFEIRILKQVSTNRLWKGFNMTLRKHLWKEHSFWSDGYFVCSIGEVNSDTIRKYINSQG